MRIEKQNVSLSVKNYDKAASVKSFQKHGDLLRNSKRCLVVGRSGSGKTNLILSLLEHPEGLRFENIYIYSKSLHQPKYEYLRRLLKPLKEIEYNEYDNEEAIVPPFDIKPNSVIIFDDIPCRNQNIIRDYFTFGRHKNTDCFFLFQGYSSIIKQLLRENSNFLILFEQDLTSLKHIYNDHCMIDMSFDEFKKLCSLCWKEDFGFVVIDKDRDINEGKYRKNFDSFIYL